MAMVVVGAVFVDVKGFPEDNYIPTGRNAGRVEFVHGGVGRNVAEDIANVELRPWVVSLVDDNAAGAAGLKSQIMVNAVGAYMSIASQRRDFLQSTDCFVCNVLEAGILFVTDFSQLSPEELCEELSQRVISARIPAVVVTMGSKGSVYADMQGNKGVCPAETVQVRDTTGAGDAFCAGVAMGLTYGKTMPEALEIGTRLAASVITVSENVCPRFLPRELGLDVEVTD